MRSKKGNSRTIGIIAGIGGAFAVGQWPSHTVPIQMALYTIIVIMPLLLGLWQDRSHPRFWPGIVGVVALHCMVLYLIRASFPFRTAFTIVPMALAEAIVLIVVMLKLLGDGGNDQDVHHTS